MNNNPSSFTHSLLAGLAGATVLTAIHEAVRRQTSNAPRMDTYGRRALAKAIEFTGHEPPSAQALQTLALGGDIVGNALYFATIGIGPRQGGLLRGALTGAAAGVGAVTLGPLMNLGKAPARKTDQTAAMTIAWYTFGGLASAVVYRALRRAA